MFKTQMLMYCEAQSTLLPEPDIAILASFVNFLLPPLTKGWAGVGYKNYDSCKDCYTKTLNFCSPLTNRL